MIARLGSLQANAWHEEVKERDDVGCVVKEEGEVEHEDVED